MQEDQNIREEASSRETSPKKKRFRPTKRFIIGGVILTLAVVAIVVAAFLLADIDRRPNYGLYVKNGSLYYTDLKGNPFLITSNLTASNGNLPDVEYDMRYCATLSDNGSYLFFPQNMTISGEDVQTFDLCYQNIEKKERQTVLIAENVTDYHISDDAMTVTYLTADGLYRYELKPAESNLVCANVFYYAVSDNSSRMIYLTGNNELFAQAAGYARVKIDNMVDEVLYVDDGFKNVIYRQENSLHKWVSGKGESEICADVINHTVYESGEVLLLSNAMGYSELYYYDGQDTTLVMEHVEHLVMTAKNEPVCLLTAPESAEESEATEAGETEELSIRSYLISGKTVYEPQVEGLRCVGMSGNGKKLYFVQIGVQYSALYEMTIGAFGIDEPQIYDTDVYCGAITVTADGKVIYFKEVDEPTQTGKLHLNKEELNQGVPLFIDHYQNFSLLPDSKQIFYFTNYDPEQYSGVLHVASTDGVNRQISGQALLPFMLHNGQILFMENYKAGEGGELYVYIGGSTILIDTGVTFYIPVI